MSRSVSHQPQRPEGTQSIQRSTALLRMVATHNRLGLRIVDLCKLSGLRRPTVQRIVGCLAAEGLIARHPKTGSYHLGHLIYELGLTAAPAFKLQDVCATHLARLAETTGDMVFLVVRSGYDALCIDRKEGPFPIRTYTLEVGTRRPLGIGAGSLAILGALSSEEAAEVVEHNKLRLAAHNGLTGDKLLRMAEQTRQRGYAMHDGSVSGARAVGLALRDSAGRAYAGISVSGITSRMQPQRCSAIARQIQAEIELIEAATRRHGTPGTFARAR